MIDTLVVVVYDRYQNLVKWFDILKQCERPKNVVVIHNYDSPHQEYKKLCDDNNALYIHRQNIGFDIGCFQDVCMSRLPGFPDWNELLWCTDDTFPLSKDFINYFSLQPGEGVRAMEISPYVHQHIRTTGFSISKSTAQRLKFPADPITTKQHCYLFEHRGGRKTFMEQVKAMRLKVVMVASREKSPMFDTGYHRRLNRDKELEKTWNISIPSMPAPMDETVTIICPIYQSFPAVVSSLIMQTHRNWKLILVHDGPSDGGVRAFIESINDDRIEYLETEKHAGNWGHTIRRDWLQKVKTEYVVITNPDNYYAPVFLEYLIRPLSKSGAIAAYSSGMIHSYKAWQLIPCSVKRGYIDCGGVVLKTKQAQEAGWHNITDHSADWFFFEGIANKFGRDKFIPVKGVLFIHN
jgi:GT2 family glycosyltransferase